MNYDLIKQAARLHRLADLSTYGEDCTRYLAQMDRVTAQYALAVGVSLKNAHDTLSSYLAEVAS